MHVPCQGPGRVGSLQGQHGWDVWGIRDVQDKTMNGRRDLMGVLLLPCSVTLGR